MTKTRLWLTTVVIVGTSVLAISNASARPYTKAYWLSPWYAYQFGSATLASSRRYGWAEIEALRAFARMP